MATLSTVRKSRFSPFSGNYQDSMVPLPQAAQTFRQSLDPKDMDPCMYFIYIHLFQNSHKLYVIDL